MEIRPSVDIKNIVDNHMRPHKNGATSQTNEKKIEAFAKNYEGFMLGVMFDQMYAGVEVKAPFGGGHAEKTFRSMMLHEQAKDFAHKGGLGLSDDIKRQLIMEQASNSEAESSKDTQRSKEAVFIPLTSKISETS